MDGTEDLGEAIEREKRELRERLAKGLRGAEAMDKAVQALRQSNDFTEEQKHILTELVEAFMTSAIGLIRELQERDNEDVVSLDILFLALRQRDVVTVEDIKAAAKEIRAGAAVDRSLHERGLRDLLGEH